MKGNQNIDENGQIQMGSLARRQFIKGMGVSAALAMTSLPIQSADAKVASAPQSSAGPLRDSPLVMIWRRVSSLPNSQAFANRVLQLPTLGKDPISVMYDGGGVILGFAIQEAQPSNEPVLNACSEVGLQDFFLQNNPASAIVFAPADFKAALRNLYTDRTIVTAPEKSDAGECLRFVDDDGNFSCFYRPSRSALLDHPAGEKLSSILKNRWPRKGARLVDAVFEGDSREDAALRNPVVGFDLLVTDLAKSKRYYTDVLGFKLLDSSDQEAKLDVGDLVLTLRVEPTNMLVQFLRKSGRLLGDWIVFHTEEIKKTSNDLRAAGVAFPAGIETSLIGQVAYFTDPDGYSLALWEPSGKTKMIDFNPALGRILSEVRARRGPTS
jgi:catechol 2,3-dioxygenase-like lactoylglutathione lyase family enzyme